MINLVLAVFNLIPIPPLDGSHVVAALLPARAAYQYAQFERYGMLLLFALLWTGFLGTPPQTVHARPAMDPALLTADERPRPAVFLPAFEGPLDLLLHLVRQEKVSIWDIPIARDLRPVPQGAARDGVARPRDRRRVPGVRGVADW